MTGHCWTLLTIASQCQPLLPTRNHYQPFVRHICSPQFHRRYYWCIPKNIPYTVAELYYEGHVHWPILTRSSSLESPWVVDMCQDLSVGFHARGWCGVHRNPWRVIASIRVPTCGAVICRQWSPRVLPNMGVPQFRIEAFDAITQAMLWWSLTIVNNFYLASPWNFPSRLSDNEPVLIVDFHIYVGVNLFG